MFGWCDSFMMVISFRITSFFTCCLITICARKKSKTTETSKRERWRAMTSLPAWWRPSLPCAYRAPQTPHQKHYAREKKKPNESWWRHYLSAPWKLLWPFSLPFLSRTRSLYAFSSCFSSSYSSSLTPVRSSQSPSRAPAGRRATQSPPASEALEVQS